MGAFVNKIKTPATYTLTTACNWTALPTTAPPTVAATLSTITTTTTTTTEASTAVSYTHLRAHET